MKKYAGMPAFSDRKAMQRSPWKIYIQSNRS